VQQSHAALRSAIFSSLIWPPNPLDLLRHINAKARTEEPIARRKSGPDNKARPAIQKSASIKKARIFLMTIHKQILEWQAAHPNITWIGWGIVWAIVLALLFWPRRALG
jgi:hypothetical protein